MAKKKASQRTMPPPLPRRVVEGLYEAERLLDKRQPEAARQLLEDLDHERPGLAPVLELLVNACVDLQDMQGYEWALYRLLKIDQSDPDAAVGMAGAYMANFRPALAAQAFQRFLSRWQDHERASEARKTLAKIQAALHEEMDELNLPESEMFDLVLQNEEVRFFMDHQQYRQARQVAEKLLKKYPSFVPAINNLSQVHALQGEAGQAIALSERVLEIAPDNVHALSNLTRLLFLAGKLGEATQMAQKMKDSRARAADLWTKKAEALAYLADHDGLLELYHRSKPEGKSEESALFLHLIAVAMYTKGQEREARRLWRQALKIEPSFELARQNLDDLDRPIGERNAPWAFSLHYWITERTLRELYQTLKTGARMKNEQAARGEAGKFLQQHPEIISLTPRLLTHGDAKCREFVLNLVRTTRDPALLRTLREFALGQRGSDELRMQAAELLSEEDILPSGSVRLWMKGEWRDILMFNFEITPEAEVSHKHPKVQALAEEAFYALREEDGRRAQELLEEAIALDPDSPSLHNNLAMAYEIQGQPEKAHAMIREIHARFPDYFFGIADAARLAIKDGDLDTAHELLNSLLERKRLHVSEFDTLCAAQIEAFLAEKNQEAARTWFELWERPDPENPKLDVYRWQVGKGSSDSLLKRPARK